MKIKNLPLILTGMLIMGAQLNAQDEVFNDLERFGDAFDLILNNYVEEVDSQELIDAAINGMLQSLDPHSSYLNSEAVDAMQEDTSGEFAGLGIEITQEDGLIKIVSPFDGAPAAEAGLMPGDYITHADGQSLMGLSIEESVDLLRGPVGSVVIVTIFREGVDEPFDVEITRNTISVPSASVRAIGNVGYIRISQFNEQSLPNVLSGVKAIEDELGQENLKGFVVDLRNNPGGLLTTAIEITDAFLEEGEIVSTRGRIEGNNSRASAQKGDIAQGLPVVVLINGGSASASEIVAGALQDHKRAVIVGTTSFGKGSVQTIFDMNPRNSQDTVALRMTTARYYTPSGRSIQGLGVEPDVYVEQRPPKLEDEEKNTSQAFDNLGEKSLRGALDNDSISDEEREKLEAERAEFEELAKIRDTDFQLSYALDLLRGLSVYEE